MINATHIRPNPQTHTLWSRPPRDYAMLHSVVPHGVAGRIREVGVTGMSSDLALENEIGTLLVERKKTLSVAESCTGGMLASRITSVGGSSAYFLGGIIAYANAVKVRELGIDPDMLERDGAVSDAVARGMAQSVRMRFCADFGIGITGIAGPSGGVAEKEVGLVYIAVASVGSCTVKECHFEGDRTAVREASCRESLRILKGEQGLREGSDN